MVNDILTPMNHREIEYDAKKLSECEIPEYTTSKELLTWLDDTGNRVFDDDLVMDYGTDCLRLYLLFENTPKEKDAPYYDSWQEGALEGLYKFLGRYRRVILAADEWNKRGNYNPDIFPTQRIDQMNRALEQANAKMNKCISRGNTMPNRHNIVSALMELLNIFQKELKIGEIVTALHSHAIETAAPHKEADPVPEYAVKSSQNDNRNPQVTELCLNLIVLMAPYAPDMSKVLWNYLNRR